MSTLKKSKNLQRKIRQDPVSELMISTWTRAEEALRAGKLEEGLELMEYGHREEKHLHDTLGYLVAFCADFVAQNLGEEKLPELWRVLSTRLGKSIPGIRHAATNEEQIQLAAELQRGHCSGPTGHGDAVLIEEPDRYVMTISPCGTGGRMRLPGNDLGRTSKPYPWSWNQAGVPYYCTHCCTFLEIAPIEARGYPVRVHENPDWSKEVCQQIFYKSPELIPEKYFTRVGKKKDLSKFTK